MSLLKFLFISFLFVLTSCSDIEFLYGDTKNLTNPLYKNVSYKFEGNNIPGLYVQASRYLGVSESPMFELKIQIKENKTKRSVESNQAIAKMDYELEYFFTLKKLNEDCDIYNKKIFSRFSYVPKSSGYNYGSDESLEKMYELASKNSLEKFVNNVSDINLTVCDNES